MRGKYTKEVLRELNEAWIEEYTLEKPNYNPLDILDSSDPYRFQKQLTWLLMQPEYFYFLCKHVFNVDLAPFQCVILQELWSRKFPMLIGSRGLSKTFLLSLYALLRALLIPNRRIVIAGAAFRQSKMLHDYMETIWSNAPVLRDLCDQNSGGFKAADTCRFIINGSVVAAIPVGDGCVVAATLTTRENGFCRIVDKSESVYGNGKLRNIEYNIDNGIKPTKIVTTKLGYSYEGTYNHAMKVLRKDEIIWVRTDDMRIGDRILIDRSERWHNGDSDCTNDEAYALGLLIGDGCWTKKYHIGFATTDTELIDSLNLAFDNGFTQQSDLVHYRYYGIDKVKSWIDFWGLEELCYTKNKTLPLKILMSSQDKMTKCIQGLFDTDGHICSDTSKGGVSVSVNFTNTSEELVRQLQYILLHYGIVSNLRHRDRDEKWERIYELGIYGINVKKFAEKINFSLSRKRDQLNGIVENKKRWVSNKDTIPILPTPGRKTVQMSYACKNIHKFVGYEHLINPDIYYDEITSIEDSESHTYDIHVPDGNEYCANGFFSHNSKIRGLRGDLIADEFSAHTREIFENVMSGFGAVNQNPVVSAKLRSKQKKAKELGITLDAESKLHVTNQIILSGTAYYDFNHFADYWRKWRKIVLSKGEPAKLREIFGENGPPKGFNWRDYSIMRIPYDLLPEGFMDEANISRSKATIHSGIFQIEFCSVFSKDSKGFFKRSSIESCTGTDTSPVKLKSGDVFFDPKLIGDPKKKYVLGIDPASEIDNFSIIVIELNDDHRKIVSCWTTNRKEHTERVKLGFTEEDNFYSYCARKIRDLMSKFHVVHIAMDSQGGGYAVSEALHETSNLKDGEVPIWPIIEDKEKPSDDEAGLHIIELVQFAKAEWTNEANHGMKKDLEDKVLLFPRFDPVSLAYSTEKDAQRIKHYEDNNIPQSQRMLDTLEDCVMEIEELKNELCLIEITQTSTGRDRWDVPEVKVGVGKKEKMRKDRYSALLMANMAARQYSEQVNTFYMYGGFAATSTGKPRSEFEGPAWFTQAANGLY